MLDYQPAKPHYHLTVEDQKWLLYRLCYYGLHLLFCIVIGFWIGPNLQLFHSPFSPAPKDYVQYTQGYINIIAAIKAYQRDFGTLPFDCYSLPPEYKPYGYNGEDGEILNTTSVTFVVANGHGVLEYEFNPMKEGWYIHTPHYDGRLPAPNVRAAPKPPAVNSANPTSNSTNGK